MKENQRLVCCPHCAKPIIKLPERQFLPIEIKCYNCGKRVKISTEVKFIVCNLDEV